MKTKKLFLVLLLVLTATMMIWAGGAQEKDTDGSKLPELTIFNNRPARQSIPEAVDFWDNPYINFIRESSGIDPIYIRPETSTYYDKLTLIMSSGDMPELIQGRVSDLCKYAEEGLLVPLDDLLKENGQDILDHIPAGIWEHLKYDGKIYGLPAIYFYPIPGKDSIPNRILWVRRDWMNALDLEEPTTLDEYVEILRQFKNNDPDGNGVNDTMGLSGYMKNGDIGGLDHIFGAFGVIQTTGGQASGPWSEVNGEIVYNPTKPEMKDALAFLNSMYEEGLLDPEFYLNNSTQWMEKVYQGKIGTWLGSWWEPENRTDRIVNTTGVASLPGGLITPIHSPIGPNGDKGNNATLSLSEGVYFVTVDAEDPALAVKFYNWRFSDKGIDYDFGFEGTNFTKVDGVRVKSKETPVDAYARAYHTSYVPWNEEDFLQYVVDTTKNDTDMFEIAWEALEISAEDGVTSVVPYYQPPSLIEYGPELQKLWVETAVHIITGEADLDRWDEFVTLWYANGGAEITKDMNKYYYGK